MTTILGIMLLISAVLMARSAVLVKRSEGRNVTQELQREMSQARNGVVSQIREAEAEFLESVRVLEAELDTRRAILDRLIADADERIIRLEDRIDHAASVEPPLRRAA